MTDTEAIGEVERLRAKVAELRATITENEAVLARKNRELPMRLFLRITTWRWQACRAARAWLKGAT